MAREARNIQDYEILNHGSVFFIIKVAIPGTMASHSPPKLTEPLPCPRCDSTNTITTTSLNLDTSASHIAVTGLKAELFVTFSSSSSVTHEAEPTPMVVSPTSVMPGPRIKPEMVFNFTTGQHNVAEVTEYGYDNCSITNAISTLTTGRARITLNKTDHRYFICGFPNYCLAS
ncbi:uncharacterized protein [Gossypium hirsutum]|uniref:Phytocyanin domain-containing protein n=1 Tax=Gossypium hirsutum TaxID=3635 RepID=A0A1U8PYM0_GOSHI|nr:uncharacterized protein LOC107963312 [Gossypium hirsutum]